MRKTNFSKSFFVVMAAASFCASAQDQKSILDKLSGEYTLTKPTADKTDIVTAGSILVLQKDNLLMVPTTSQGNGPNTYKEGRITQTGIGGKLNAFARKANKLSQSAAESRTFVAGEKMWVTKIDPREDGVYFELFTDAFSDVRYKALLKFQYIKGPIPPADQVAKMVREVFKIQPAEDAKDDGQKAPAGGQQAPAAGAQAAPERAPAPIAAPPPPPADAAPPPIEAPPPPPQEPKTITLGLTIDQVVGILGQPLRIANLGKKQIYTYKDLKVTFVDGKVTDIQ